MKILKLTLLVLAIYLLIPAEAFSQVRVTTRGTSTFRKVGIHRGNQVRTVFSNYGVIAQPGDQGPRGAWKYDANGYVGDVSPLVGIHLPVKDYDMNDTINAKDTIHSVIITPVSRPGGGDYAPGGAFWGFEPIPGFANASLNELGKGVAMSNLSETWPTSWPDFPTWTYSGDPIIVDGKDVTPAVDWNGYFGRGQINADQESYFWMDDNPDEKMYQRHGFLSDTLDITRRGHGLQVAIRGLQWSNFLAQNVLFWLYNIKNDGTERYDQAVFGTLVGTYIGAEGDEWNDDASFFDVRESITYTFDIEPGYGGKGYIRPSANAKWQPNQSAVGYIAYAFLESPGNGIDGVDNDGDNQNFSGSAKFFTLNDFNGRTIQPNDKLILIDKSTFARTPFVMPNDTVTVTSMGVKYFLNPNVTKLYEGNIDVQGNVNKNSFDGADNDLDGLIDENYIIHYRQYKKSPAGVVLIDTLNPIQYKDFAGNIGLSDLMVDERRDDGIDNDGDWTATTDDVGLDGKPNTGDTGERDGLPTSGFQMNPSTGKLEDTGFPGEPNIDKTDVDESDQLGLTSFQYFVPANDIKMNDDEDMWRRLNPGYFDVPASVVGNVATRGEDGDFMYGSGYFPLLPGKTERFSLALAYGEDLKGVIKTKQIAQLIYNANYNFPQPPDKPTLKVVAGDKQVTLYWDSKAENSIDPTTKEKDFEGYKIYKGTDPDFTDALLISDASGQKVFLKPYQQFDLKNGITGLFISTPGLYELTNGAPFNLGSDNGIVNSYVDKEVTNGRTYYYAVVAYDRGRTDKDIYPSENTRYISKDVAGKISTDKNTGVAVPNAPVLGYVPPESGKILNRLSGGSTATPYFEVVDPTMVKNTTYTVSFTDSTNKGVDIAYAYTVKDSLSGDIVLDQSRKLYATNGEIFDGIRLSIDGSYQNPDSVKPNPSISGWKINNSVSADTRFLKYILIQWIDTSDVGRKVMGEKPAKDYVLVFSNEYKDSSNDLSALFQIPLPVSKKLNFKAFDVTEKANPKQVKFMFFEPAMFDPIPKMVDTLSADDILVFSNEDGTKISWEMVFSDTGVYIPKGGDTLQLSFFRPISSSDKFIFSTVAAGYNSGMAKDSLTKVRAVPNPYVVSNIYESPLPPTIRGRGERIINFINVPSKGKIHIYTSSGNHIRTLEHDGDLNDGSIIWDLKTKEGLDVAFGVYFYVVEAEGISDKKYGKLAIIK